MKGYDIELTRAIAEAVSVPVIASGGAGTLACFYSHSREKLWLKGETSGNFLWVKEILLDCGVDTLLLRVAPDGPACHTGERSCFYRSIFPFGGTMYVGATM